MNDNFFKNLVDITEQRDIQRLELSLLKTAYGLLNPRSAAFFRQTSHNEPEISSEIVAGQVVCHPPDSTNEEFTEWTSRENSIIFSVPGTLGMIGYLVAECDSSPSTQQRTMVEGACKVYINFLEILEESRRDQLTGLLNRRTFDDHFQSVVNRMVEQNLEEPDSNRRPHQRDDSFWLAMLDIDHFKRINDTYGHLFGDEVLILVSRFLSGAVRRNDAVFRFGGEEFIIILQAGSREVARLSFERLRRSIENHSFPQIGQVTVSIGVTCVDGSLIPPLLIGEADRALYHAKENGRNRLSFYDELTDENKNQNSPKEGEIELF